MRPEQLRAVLQLVFVLLFLPVLSFFGLACFCYPPPPQGSDSSHSGPEQMANIITEDRAAGAGTVMRYHSVGDATMVASKGEAATMQQALPEFFFGVGIPTAPGMSASGQISATTMIVSTGTSYTLVDLKPDAARSDQLTSLFPPAQGTTWVALVVDDPHVLDTLLGDQINLTTLRPALSYMIEFGGSNPCNGCEVPLTGCVPGKFGALLPPGVAAAAQVAADGSLVCSPPTTSYITLFGAPLRAAFGLGGGTTMTTSTGSTVALPLMLEHTNATTLTFTLSPTQSALGWSYQWEDAQRNPINQIAVAPRDPFGPQPPPNLYVTASGLPTCTQVIDVVNVAASGVLTPALQASSQAYISVVPDAATCPVADVATHHLQQTNVISGGHGITYTLTISNLTDAVQGGIVVQTITPAEAVRGADLPAGCSRAGAVITCQLDNIAAQGAASATVVVLSSSSYAGELSSSVQATPVEATDASFLDNVDGPLAATVQPNEDAPGLYMPLLNSGR